MAGRENGAALLMSLVILLVLTLLAVSGMQGSIMQERMTSAQREGVVALESAEAGLRQAESVLEAMSDLSSFGAVSGYYDANDADLPSPYDNSAWADSNQTIAGTAVSGVVPRYFFEFRGPVTLEDEGELPRDLGRQQGAAPVEFQSARIVVMAPGPSGSGRRIIETFYVFDLN
jgi:type IV pilus assembly protein PilX